MPRYKITDDETGASYILTFDHDPTDEELREATEAAISGKGGEGPGFLKKWAVEKPAAFLGSPPAGFYRAGSWAYGAMGAVERLAAGVNRWMGDDEAAERKLRNAEELDAIAAIGSVKAREWSEKVSGLWPHAKYPQMAGETVGIIAPTLIAAPAAAALGAGTVGVIGATAGAAGLQQSAGYLQEARAEHMAEYRGRYPNMSDEDLQLMAIGRAAPWAALSGAKTALFTGIGGAVGGRFFGTLGPEAAGVGGRIGGRGASAAARQIGGAAGLEAVEEGIDEAVQSAIDKWTIHEEMTGSEAVERTLSAGLMGMMFGGAIETAVRGEQVGAADVEAARVKQAEDADAAMWQETAEPILRRSAERAVLRRHNAQKQMQAAGVPVEGESVLEQQLRGRVLEEEIDPFALELKELLARPVPPPVDPAVQAIEAPPARGEKRALERGAKLKLPREGEEFLERYLKGDIPVAEQPVEFRKTVEVEEPKAPYPEKALKPVPLKTVDEMLDVRYAPTTEPRRAPSKEMEAGVLKGQAVDPDIAGPRIGVTYQGAVTPPVPPDVKSGLEFLRGGPQMGRTVAEYKAHRKRVEGKLLTSAEIGTLKKFQKKLEAWREKRRGRTYSDPTVFGQAAVTAGIEAGILAAKAGQSVSAVLDAAVDGAKKAGLKSDVNISELRDVLANGIEGELSSPPAALSTETSADLIEQAVSQDIIETRNLSKWRSLLDDSSPRSELTSEQQLEAEQELYRQLNDNETVGNIEIENLPTGAKITSREMAQEAINAYDGYNGDMSESRAFKLSEDLGITYDEASDIFATLNQFSSSSEAEIGRRIREAAAEHSGGEAGEAPSFTRKKLVKMRNSLRSYRKKHRGRVSALPVDIIAAQLMESALNVALKAINAGQSIAKALDAAYASLGETSVSRGSFDGDMLLRMRTALDEMVAGNTPEGAMIAATAVDSSIMPDEISKQHQLLLESEDAGIELPPPDSTGGWVRNKREWVWNTGLGRMEDSLEDLGIKQLSMQWNFFEHQVKRLQGRFAGMIFDREGGYNSSKNWSQIWTTVKTEKMKVVEAEVEAYVRKRYQWQTKEKDENGKIAVATEPPYEALSPLAKNLVDGMGEAYKKSGDYSRDEVGVFVLDSKGNVELGKFELGETGWPGGMAPEFRSLLDSLDRGSKVTEDIVFLIDGIGRTVDSVKGKKGEEGLNALIDWRDSGRKKAEASGYTSSENTAQQMSQLEKKREHPVHSDLMSFTVETFHGYINNWARRIAEIQAFGQSIDPVYKGQDLFDIVLGRLKAKGKGKDDPVWREVEKAKAAAYRNPALRGWVGKEGEKAAAAFEAFASLTMLTGVASAIRNGTGTFQTVAGAYYAGNTAAALKGHARFLKADKLLGLKYAAIDASKLRSWGVLQQDMTHLMTGFEASEAVIQKAMGRINSALRTIRKAQGIALSTTGFKGTEFMVRSISALTAHTLATDAIDANRNGDKPKLVDGFKSFAEDMKNVNAKKILDGDEDAMVDFIVRFVTDTQGGYTPNQLPFWMSTPMGKFMGKFMPYGIMMNQFHQKNIARRKNKAFEEAGEDKAAKAKVVNGIKKYGAGYFRTYKDLMVMFALFGGGGEAFWQLMALLFGGSRDVPTFREMASEDATLPDSMKMVAERLYDNVLFTGTLGAVMELAQPLVSLTGAKGSRAKELTEPAGLAVVKNVWQLTEDLISQETVVDPELVEKYIEKQLSIYRYGKRATAQAANALELEWDWARRHEKQQDYYMLRNAGRRYAKQNGIDVDVFFRGGRYLPNPYTRFYDDVKDELYLGNVSEAKQAAMDLAAVMGDDRDRAWSRLSASITGSQPLKIGRYSNTDIQNDFLRWAKRNLPYDDYVRIVNLQQTYEGTARGAGLISGGEPSVVRNMKIRMNLKKPKGRKRKRSTTSGSAADYLKGEQKRMEKALGR